MECNLRLKSCLVIVIIFATLLAVGAGPQLFQDKALFDAKHGVKMGVPNGGCDDGQTNLDVDWDGNSINYTCFYPTKPIMPDMNIESLLHCDDVPRNFMPKHHCMQEKIPYQELLPTYGDHRPLWPKFGEYRFVPKERWLHNIEHGAVIMLYDPCVLQAEVNKLKEIVRNCIKKHIITPTTFLSPQRPMALIAWGCKLEMAYVDEAEVIQFIKERGLKGPEGDMGKDGQYDLLLQNSSAEYHKVGPSQLNDVQLCPKNP